MSNMLGALGSEWGDIADYVRDKILSRLVAMGSDESLRNHALGRLAPPRLLYVATVWVDDCALRRKVALGAGLHMLGINLIDDLLDQDTNQACTELTCAGSFLLQSGASILCTLARSQTGWKELELRYQRISRATLAEMRQRPGSLQEWVDLAQVKAGEVLECYVALACLAAGKKPRLHIERSLARALGLMFAVRDDWTDFWKRREEQGNLFWLLMEGRAEMTAVRHAVAEAANVAAKAMSIDGAAAELKWLVEEQHALIEERLERFSCHGHGG